MNRQDGFDRGLAARIAVLGGEWVAQATAAATGFDRGFQEFITRYAWGEIWTDDTLDHETRRLLVLATTQALGRWEEFELHVAAALDHGVSLDRIRAVIQQGAVYAGVPSANTAFTHARRVLARRDMTPPGAPLTSQTRVRLHDTFSTPQLRVAVQGSATGRPVVLSHALGLDLGMWDALAARLAGNGYAVLRYDQRGHGGSPRSAADFGLADLVDDAARLIREWGRGPVSFVGLSLGGMVGQGLAIRHPGLVDRLVVSNTTARYGEAARAAWSGRIDAVARSGMCAVTDVLVERYLGATFRGGNPAAAARLESQLLRMDPAAYAQCARAVRDVDWTPGLDRVRVPTLVLCGTEDTAVSVADGEGIANLVPGARLALLEGAAHLPTLEQPERFGQYVLDFLAGAEAERARAAPQDGPG